MATANSELVFATQSEIIPPISMNKPRKDITPREVEDILVAYAQGMSVREVMKQVKRSRGGIHAVIQRYPERLTTLRQQCADKAMSGLGRVARLGGVGSAAVDVEAEVHPDAGGAEAPKPPRDALSTALQKYYPAPTLPKCESDIRDSLRTFYFAVGKALWTISEFHLFKPQFETFEEYCQTRWGISTTHANRQIKAVKVVVVLGEEIATQVTEWQLRPLTTLSEDELQKLRQKATTRAASAHVPLTWEVISAEAGLSGTPKRAASKGKKAPSGARTKAIKEVRRAVGDAEAAAKVHDMKAVAAAISRIRTALELLFP